MLIDLLDTLHGAPDFEEEGDACAAHDEDPGFHHDDGLGFPGEPEDGEDGFRLTLRR